MKSLIAAAAVAVGALALSAPAHADPRDGYAYNQSAPDYRGDHRGDYRGERYGGYRHSFNREDLARMNERIDHGFRTGRLTRREAERLSWQVNDLRQRARYYWRSEGTSWRERQDLDARYARLREHIRYQMRDDDRRWDSDHRGPPRRY